MGAAASRGAGQPREASSDAVDAADGPLRRADGVPPRRRGRAAAHAGRQPQAESKAAEEGRPPPAAQPRRRRRRAPPPSDPAPSEDEGLESDLERIIGHTFDARRLRRELNTADLDGVREARLCIKEGDDAGALGELLPSLRSLVLDGSHLSSLRDLGTRLQDLTKLSIKKCGLTDLDGLNAFPSFEELDISDNDELTDISDLFHHDTLSVLRARRTALTS